MIVKAHKCSQCGALSEVSPDSHIPYGWILVTVYVEGDGKTESLYCSYACAAVSPLRLPER